MSCDFETLEEDDSLMLIGSGGIYQKDAVYEKDSRCD